MKIKNTYKLTIGVLIFMILLFGTSYAFFASVVEKHGKLNIVVGTLDYQLSNDELTISSHTAKEYTIELISSNDISTKYELYYQKNTEDNNLEFGYVEDTKDEPIGEIGKGDKKEITLYIKNHTDDSQTITIGVEGGFLHNDLVLTKGKPIPKLNYSKEKLQLYTILEEAEKYYDSHKNTITERQIFHLPQDNQKLALADQTLVGNLYMQKDGRIAFQGLNHEKCLVKRYSLEEVEEFNNHHEVCQKEIYKNLVINGYGEYGNNTNFVDATYNTATNEFEFSIQDYKRFVSSSPIFIDSKKKYRYALDIYSDVPKTENYVGLTEQDIDGNDIEANMVMFMPDTLTELTQDLNKGDFVVHLKDVSHWNVTSTTSSAQRSFIFWNYQDSTGHQYPPLTYSRNTTPDHIALFTENSIDKIQNTITLINPWDGMTVPKGTAISQHNSGSTFNYCLASGINLSANYSTLSTIITGTNQNGAINFNAFRYATKSVKPFFLFDYNHSSSSNPSFVHVKNIVFEEIEE